MSRAYGGQVIERKRKTGTFFGLRFTAYGQRRFVSLGAKEHGVTRRQAEDELVKILADVRREIWRPPNEAPRPEPQTIPTFHEFAQEWFDAKKQEGGRRGSGLSDAGLADIKWRLEHHLLPTFAETRIDAITVEDVDRFRRAKVAEGKLSASSINKVLTTLAAVLEVAVEYERIARNPAKGKRRRLPSSPPKRTWIDRADHLAALLEAAGDLDAAARLPRGHRRALLATLAFAGLRLGEAVALQWRDIDLARKTLRVRASKTDAGERVVDLLPVLHEQLVEYRASLGDVDGSRLVFGTRKGKPQSRSNIRRRVLAKAVERANELLAKDEVEPLPVRLTPHSLRRTFASILIAVGENPRYVMGQLGHTDPALTLRIYTQQMDRRDGEPERLKALVNGEELATPEGTRDEKIESAPAEAVPA